MRKINYELQIRNYTFIFVCLVLLITLNSLLITSAASAAKWGGVDESVVEKYAEEHGRAARDPLINTDQGDLLLFVFLLAGTVGGFIAGYNWRRLVEKSMEKSSDENIFRKSE
jgi:ABC-type cobalt transport system substrate-binding protein